MPAWLALLLFLALYLVLTKWLLPKLGVPT
jgi:hypothetical protein